MPQSGFRTRAVLDSYIQIAQSPAQNPNYSFIRTEQERLQVHETVLKPFQLSAIQENNAFSL
jgi:hypothetical protein